MEHLCGLLLKKCDFMEKSSEHVDFMGKNGAKKIDFIMENEDFIGKKGEQMLAEKGPV